MKWNFYGHLDVCSSLVSELKFQKIMMHNFVAYQLPAGREFVLSLSSCP